MAEGLTFSVGLEDHVSPAAKASASALRELQTELSGSKAKLALYQQQLSAAKALGDVEGYRKYSALVAEARRETFELGSALVAAGGPAAKLGEGLHKVVEPAEVAHRALEGVESGLKGMASAIKSGDVAGGIEGAAEALAGMAQALDLVIPGLGSVAAGAIKAAGAIGGFFAEVVEEGVKTALEVAEVNERLTATFEALGDKPGQGAKTLAFLNDLSTELPQTRDQLARWGKEFQAFGITDLGALREQIRATAAAQAIMGEGGAEAYKKLAEKVQDAAQGHHALKMGKDPIKAIALSGVSASAVAERLGMTLEQLDGKLKSGTMDAEKFGKALSSTLAEKGEKPLEAMGNEIGTIMAKGKETFLHLFDGIDVSPITDGLKSLIALGDAANPVGADIKAGIGEGIQGVINWLGEMLVMGQVMFIDLDTFAINHRAELKKLETALSLVGSAIVTVTGYIGDLLQDRPLPAWLTALGNILGGPIGLLGKIAGVGGDIGGAIGGAAVGAMDGGDMAGGGKAKGHADGGLVGRPAPGEAFASVAPGEMIIPVQQTREILGGGIGSRGRDSAAPANINGGGGVHIEHLELTVQAAGGVTDATSLSVTGLALALERMQLASGR